MLTPEQIEEAAAYTMAADDRPLSDFSRDELMYLLMVFHRNYKEANRAGMMHLYRYGVIEQLHEILGTLRVVTDEEGLKQLVDSLHEANKKVAEYKPSETEEAA